jgi:hypothetical protein
MVESEPSSYFVSQYLDISIKLLMNLTLSKPIVIQNHNPSINQSIHSSLWYPTPALTSVCLGALSLQLDQISLSLVCRSKTGAGCQRELCCDLQPQAQWERSQCAKF